MNLIENWKDVLTKAWSVRLILLSGIFTGMEAAVSLLQADLLGIPPGMFAILAGTTQGLALVSRLLAQANLSGRF